MKNVLIVTHYANLLGANRSLLAFLIYLRTNTSYNPIVLLPFKGAMSDELEKNNISYYIFKTPLSVYEKHSFVDILKGFIRECFTLIMSLRIYFYFKNKNIELVHTNSSVTNVGAYLSMMLKVPHVWHIREFVKQHYKFSHNFGESYQISIWRKANTIITVSESLKKYYDTVLPQNKIVTIYNGVNASPSYSIGDKDMEHFDIALVGVINPGKHQDIAIKAIDKVVHHYNIKNVHLHIYGNTVNIDYDHQLKQIVSKNNLNEYVKFCGYQSNILEKTKSYQIGITASEYEAFGRVTIEYMLNGMIPIVSDSGANTEIVKDGFNGFVFQLNDVDGLAQKIVYISTNYKALNGMLDNIRETTKLYSVEANAKNILSQYNEILK